MNITKNSKTSKFVGGLLGLSMVVSFVFGGAVAPAQAATAEELQAQISSLLATISALQAQLGTVSSGPSSPSTGMGYVFSRNLKQGDTGTDVMNLQKVLNMNPATQVSTSGAGSPGNETSTFGPATKAAVVKFQNMYASEVLAPVGLSTGTGFVGAATRAKLNAMSTPSTGGPTTGGPTGPSTPVPTGTGLTVTAGAQPAASLAPANAARVPFTKVTFTAGYDGDVRVNGIVVERGGPSTNSDFAGVVLLDSNGTQVGVAKTLNSNNQATLTEPLTIPAGQSRTYTIAGNMGSSVGAGNIATLSVVGVNTPATVTGSLPITGTAQTVNGTLTIGSVTVQNGSTDPGGNQTKEVGTTGYTFSSFRVTAGSTEKVVVKSIRWNQTGSASISDLANLKTYVDGTAYDVVASSDGKYLTSTFGTGILLDKGFGKDISIKGDIIGGSQRNIAFDIAKRADLGVIGETYGFGIIPTQTSNGNFTGSEDPWFDGYVVTVSTGNITVAADSTVAAQNIAVNVQNQTIGGFTVDVRGEPVSVGQIVFNVTIAGGAYNRASAPADLEQVTLVDGNGAVVAGPVDGSGTATSTAGTITFSDTVTFPVGVTKLQLKAKLSTDFASGDTVSVASTPNTGWTTITGQNTNNSITAAPASAVTASTMTVKTSALSVSVSSQPTARNVIAGSQGFEFARYIFDASQSGEDIRVTSIPLALNAITVSPTHLTNCQLFDGAAAVTSGSNLVNPTANSSTTAFSFDGTGLVISKGSSKTVSLKCNVSTAATSGSVQWGLDSDQQTSYTAATGLTSGQTVVETLSDSTGNTMTAATGGSYTVSKDTSITYKLAQAGATGVTLGAFQFSAGTNEDIWLRQIALQLTNGRAADLVNNQVTLWNGATQIGSAQFGLSLGSWATSTLSGNGIMLSNSGNSVTVTVKGDLAPHSAVEGVPGSYVVVSYDGSNNGINGNYGVGALSGTNISGGTTTDVSPDGIRIVRTVPTVAVTSNGGTFALGGDTYKFVVTNPNARDMVIDRTTFSLAVSGANVVGGFTLYGDGVAANATPVSAVASTTITINFDDTSTARIVPANSSKTYILRAGSYVPGSGTDQISIALLSDTAFPSTIIPGIATSSTMLAGIVEWDTTSNARFLWTPFSTTTPANTAAVNANQDWSNSYGLPGFPAVGQSFTAQTWTATN